MLGVPHRSLGRKVRDKILDGIDSWQPGNIPADAIDEFRDGEDLETSLWEDGESAQYRREVLLGLILAKRSIGPLSLALLWQDDAYVGSDLGHRIVQSDGDTPYVSARRLHLHVSNPTLEDVPRLILAAGRRKEIPSLTTEAVRDLIEDAYLANELPTKALHPTLDREIQRLMHVRLVHAAVLQAEPRRRIFDIRSLNESAPRISGASLVSEDEIVAHLHRSRIGNNDVFTLYCADGVESIRVAKLLRKGGKKPRVLIGGFAEWTRRGFETQT